MSLTVSPMAWQRGYLLVYGHPPVPSPHTKASIFLDRILQGAIVEKNPAGREVEAGRCRKANENLTTRPKRRLS